MNDSKKNNMVVQAGILAFAGIIVRVIGLLYNTPLVHIIKDEGCVYLSEALKINSSLISLNLSNNDICDDDCEYLIYSNIGLKFLSYALKVNYSLVELNFKGIDIENEDLKYLSDALDYNIILTELII